MDVTTNQKSKEDKRLARIVLVAETDEDHELLFELLEYLEHRQTENKTYADLRVQV